MMFGIIYKITNVLNGKIYIGQTTKTLNRRWVEHCWESKHDSKVLFHCAIQKYGKENFTVEQIDVACDRDELDKKEIHWIKFYNSMNRDKGYNQESGGLRNKVVSERVRKIMSQKRQGEKNYMYGKHHTLEAREKIRQSKLGKISPMRGKKLSLESRLKISKSKIGKPSNREKKVICIETGDIFESALKASLFIGKCKDLVKNACRGRCKTAGGYHWRYLNG